MTTTVEIPEDLARAVQRRAAEGGRDVAAEVVELVRKGLAVSEPAEPAATLVRPVITTDPKTGLPVIRGAPDEPRPAGAGGEPPLISRDPDTGLPVIHSPPDAPIHSMTAEQIQAIIDEELLREDLERAGISVRH